MLTTAEISLNARSISLVGEELHLFMVWKRGLGLTIRHCRNAVNSQIILKRSLESERQSVLAVNVHGSHLTIKHAARTTLKKDLREVQSKVAGFLFLVLKNGSLLTVNQSLERQCF